MGELTHPSIVSFLESAIPRIRAAGKAVGVMVKNKAEMEHFLKMGANFLVYGVDTFVVNRAISEGVADFLSLNKA